MNEENDPSTQSDPKIIVDSDWKEQVAKEKEKAAMPVDNTAEEAVDEPTPTPQQQDKPQKQSMPAPPPASFEFLVFSLFNQAMYMLGQVPDPDSGEATVNKPYAKHYIDTLDILSEKTKGNLSDEEASMISETLHALRMTYVNTK